MSFLRIREAVLVVGGVLTAIGLVPADVVALVAENAEPIVGGAVALYGVVSAIRRRMRRQK